MKRLTVLGLIFGTALRLFGWSPVDLNPPPGVYKSSVAIPPPKSEYEVYYRLLDAPISVKIPWTVPLELKALPGSSKKHRIEFSQDGPLSQKNSFVAVYEVESENLVIPKLSLESGVYRTSQKILVSSPYSVFYSINQSEPKMVVDGQILLRANSYETQNFDLVFYTKDSKGSKGPEAIRKIVILANPLANSLVRVLSPSEGNYLNPQMLILQPDLGVTIYYTLDGSEPNESSLVYSQPVQIPPAKQTALTLKALRYATGEKAGKVIRFQSTPDSLGLFPQGGLQLGPVNIPVIPENSSISLNSGLRFQTLEKPLELLGIDGQWVFYEILYHDGNRNYQRHQYVWDQRPQTLPVANWDKSVGYQLEISASGSGIIKYTLDGSTPSLQSPTYSRPLSMGMLTGVSNLKAALVNFDGKIGPELNYSLEDLDLNNWIIEPSISLQGVLTLNNSLASRSFIRYEIGNTAESVKIPGLQSPIWSDKETLNVATGWTGKQFLRFALQDPWERIAASTTTMEWYGDFRIAGYNLNGIPESGISSQNISISANVVSGILRYELYPEDDLSQNIVSNLSPEFPESILLQIPEGVEKTFVLFLGIYDKTGNLLEPISRRTIVLDKLSPPQPELVPGSLERGLLEINSPQGTVRYELELKGLGKSFKLKGEYTGGIPLPIDNLEYYELTAQFQAEDEVGNLSEALQLEQQQLSGAVFVSPGALGTGTRDDPTGSLSQALDVLNQEGWKTILLAKGEYLWEDPHLVKDLRLLGGFDPLTWKRSGTDFSLLKLKSWGQVKGFKVENTLILEGISLDLDSQYQTNNVPLFEVQGLFHWNQGKLNVAYHSQPIFTLTPEGLMELTQLDIKVSEGSSSILEAQTARIALEKVNIEIHNWLTPVTLFKFNDSKAYLGDLFVHFHNSAGGLLYLEMIDSDVILNRSRAELFSPLFSTALVSKGSFFQANHSGFVLGGEQSNLFIQSDTSTLQLNSVQVDFSAAQQINRIFSSSNGLLQLNDVEFQVKNGRYNSWFELQNNRVEWTRVKLFSEGVFEMLRAFRLQTPNFLMWDEISIELNSPQSGAIKGAQKELDGIQFKGPW